MKEKDLPMLDVEIEHSGKKHCGYYTVDRGYVTVTYGMARKSAKYSQGAHREIARLLLSELVSESIRGF